MLGGLFIRSNEWPLSLLHSCLGVSLRTSHRTCMEVGPSCMMVSSSKRLRQMRNNSARAAVLFVYSLRAENLCMVSIAVSLRNHLWTQKETYRWLKSSNLPAATEGLVVAAQDQALRTRYYECNILNQNVSLICRLHSVGLQTVDHIVAGCSALALMDYTDRHNQVASIIH